MEFKDYYAALGVAPDADDKAIKQAYRKLARQYHPDVKPGDKASEERFKEINEGYQALSNPERRKKYDELRKQYQQWSERGGRGDFDWGQWQAAPGQGAYSYDVSAEDLEDLFGGGSPFSDFFGSIFGQAGGGPAGAGRAARPRRGRDHEAGVEITLEEAFHGTTRSLQIGDRRIEARIPAGLHSGSRVRLTGQGSPGVAGASAGDLYLVVEVAPHPVFSREGDDLRTEAPVDFYTAALGGEARVPTIDGAVTLKIPAAYPGGQDVSTEGQRHAPPRPPVGTRRYVGAGQARAARAAERRRDRGAAEARRGPEAMTEGPMTEGEKGLDAEEAARVARLDVTLVWHYAELGVITPSEEGYSQAQVSELRRARRLHEDLGLDPAAIEVVLRMARRIRELSAEVRRLESERPSVRDERDWLEAEWEDRG